MSRFQTSIDPFSPFADRRKVTRYARAEPTRVLEQQRPGPVTVYLGDGRPMRHEPDRRINVRMSTPKCLLDGSSEAAKQRQRAHRMATFAIVVRTGTIGPDHDPYGTERVIVRNKATGVRGEWYSDGLGRNSSKVLDATGVVARHEEWMDGHGGAGKASTEANARRKFTELVGIDPDEARGWYDECYEPDAYGSARQFM